MLAQATLLPFRAALHAGKTETQARKANPRPGL
jgi:hypothetical protein